MQNTFPHLPTSCASVSCFFLFSVIFAPLPTRMQRNAAFPVVCLRLCDYTRHTLWLVFAVSYCRRFRVRIAPFGLFSPFLAAHFFHLLLFLSAHFAIYIRFITNGGRTVPQLNWRSENGRREDNENNGNSNHITVLYSHHCSRASVYSFLCANIFNANVCAGSVWGAVLRVHWTDLNEMFAAIYASIFHFIWSCSISGHSTASYMNRQHVFQYENIYMYSRSRSRSRLNCTWARSFVWCRRIRLSSSSSCILFSCFLRRVSRPPAQPLPLNSFQHFDVYPYYFCVPKGIKCTRSVQNGEAERGKATFEETKKKKKKNRERRNIFHASKLFSLFYARFLCF